MRSLLLIFLSSFLIFPLNSYPKQKIKVDNYLDVAALFKETMEYEKAIDVIERALIKSKDSQLKKYLGQLYYLAGHSKRALKAFTELKDKDWLVFLYLGLVYEDLGNLSLALDSYSESIKLKKTSLVLYRCGKIYYRQRKYAQAEKFFSQAISTDSSIRLACYYLGECFFKTGSYGQSYRYLAKAINFYPQNKKIKEKLAVVKKKLGEKFFARELKKMEKKRKELKLVCYKRDQDSPLVRVGIAKNLKKFSFRAGENFEFAAGRNVFVGEGDKFYTITLKGEEFVLSDYEKDIVYKRFSSPLEIKGDNVPFYILNLIYGKGSFWHKEIDRTYRGDLKVVAKEGGITLINIVSTEEYLYGVLPAEIPSKAKPEALKAQAVAARTVVSRALGRPAYRTGRHEKEGFDCCSDVHCQVYQGASVETLPTTEAVRETKGEVITYKGSPIEVFYHANCGGCLRADAFGAREYLVSKFDSKNCEISSFSPYQEELWFKQERKSFCSHTLNKGNFRWQRVYDSEDFFLIFGFKLSNLKSILPKSKGDCFRYKTIEVATSLEKTTLNKDLTIRDYFDKLRSSAFRAEIKFSPQKEPQMLFFWGAGFGHGAGMCQEGAMRQAEEGYSYKEILKHYYPNTAIEKRY